jgi:hypothetical protein
MSSINISPQLIQQLVFVTKKQNVTDAIVKLIENEVQRKINMYQYMNSHFEKKYKMPFQDFENAYLKMDDHATIEQDYFDWDMAITVLEDI